MRNNKSGGRCAFCVQPLEPRVLLASFTSFTSKGTLTVVGTGGNDRIAVASVAQNVRVTRGSASIDYPTLNIKRLWINAYQGNEAV